LRFDAAGICKKALALSRGVSSAVNQSIGALVLGYSRGCVGGVGGEFLPARGAKDRSSPASRGPCVVPGLEIIATSFQSVNGFAARPSESEKRHARAPITVECSLSNTHLKTAFPAVQNASSSLPGEPSGLMWWCDGGGHPHVAPSGGSGALWEIGANRLRQREDRMTGGAGGPSRVDHPTETEPSHETNGG